MFSGNYTAKIDNYGRFTFPAKQLAQLGDERSMYVMLGVTGESLWLMPKSYWEEFSEFMMKERFPFGASEIAMRRQFLGNSFDTEIEGNSRIVIPNTLLERVAITGHCTIVGMGDFFEIWNPEKFLQREQEEAQIRNKAVKELGGPTKL